MGLELNELSLISLDMSKKEIKNFQRVLERVEKNLRVHSTSTLECLNV